MSSLVGSIIRALKRQSNDHNLETKPLHVHTLGCIYQCLCSHGCYKVHTSRHLMERKPKAILLSTHEFSQTSHVFATLFFAQSQANGGHAVHVLAMVAIIMYVLELLLDRGSITPT